MDQKTALTDEQTTWLATYTGLIAAGILTNLKAPLSHENIMFQLKEHRTFYRMLMCLPALHLFNELILQQVGDVEHMAETSLAEYFLSGEAEKPDDAPGESLRQQIKEAQSALWESTEKFTHTARVHREIKAKDKTILREVVVKWQTGVKLLAEKTWALLEKQNLPWKEDASSKLERCLDQQAAGQVIPPEIFKGLKIKGEAAPFEKALIQFLEQATEGAVPWKEQRALFQAFSELPEYGALLALLEEMHLSIQTKRADIQKVYEVLCGARGAFLGHKTTVEVLLEAYNTKYCGAKHVFAPATSYDIDSDLTHELG